MTARQADALRALTELAAAEPTGAVHYTDLARRLGISKWSAYEMLCVLVRQGLVERKAEKPAGSPTGGRPRVLFAPSREGSALLAGWHTVQDDEAEWVRVSHRLLQRLEQGALHHIEPILGELAEYTSALGRCAYLITSLLAMARDQLRLSQRVQTLQQLLRSPIPFMTTITTFCGMIVGWLEAFRSRDDLAERICGLLTKLEFEAARLHASERVALLGFIWAALIRIGKPVV